MVISIDADKYLTKYNTHSFKKIRKLSGIEGNNFNLIFKKTHPTSNIMFYSKKVDKFPLKLGANY